MHLVENTFRRIAHILAYRMYKFCYGDVTSAQVDPHVTGYPRMMINPTAENCGSYELCVVYQHSW
jgi:hypothetical protein